MIAPFFRRTWAISKAETSLYMRNRSIALTALLFTPLLVLASSPVILREENNVFIPTMVLQLVVNTSLLLVVYFNLTAIFVARREDGVFQRMDTGEATRWETVVAIDWVGTSPRMRGKQGRQPRHRPVGRNIPAYAGKTMMLSPKAC